MAVDIARHGIAGRGRVVDSPQEADVQLRSADRVIDVSSVDRGYFHYFLLSLRPLLIYFAVIAALFGVPWLFMWLCFKDGFSTWQ